MTPRDLELADRLLGVGAGVAGDPSCHPPEGTTGTGELADAVHAHGLGAGACTMDTGDDTVHITVARLIVVGGMAGVLSGDGAANGHEGPVIRAYRQFRQSSWPYDRRTSPRRSPGQPGWLDDRGARVFRAAGQSRGRKANPVGAPGAELAAKDSRHASAFESRA